MTGQGGRHRTGRVLALVGAVSLAAALAAGFYLGQRAAYSDMGLDPRQYREMQRELPLSRDEVSRLRGEVEVQRTRREVDRTSLEMVRREIADYRQQIGDLEEALQFYRSLMAPGSIARGLSLRSLELVATNQPQRFAYRIVAQQAARKHALIKGVLRAEVFGVLDGQEVSYPLSELSPDVQASGLPLQFRYFQTIEGLLVLPEGFDPKEVRAVASARAPRKTEVQKSFPWRVQEKFSYGQL
ncbi:MAG: hypothetical protein KDI01_04230 [Halioglobus sp.]|nr:hypothetical protein [Halioglobus sp.]